MKNHYLSKRCFDVVVSAFALGLLSPIFLVIYLWIKLDSPGPIFFKQRRVGIHKSYFDILKFRTMRTDTPKDMPTHLLKNPEQYITRSGGFLRKTSLDELPQLINILKGDMSIVGPRPALWNQYDLLAERERYGANDILPGLTGWAQIHGRDTISIEEKAELDGYYVKNQSFWLDIKCMFLTAISVLKHEGVQEGGTGAMKAEATDEKIADIASEECPLVSVVMATFHRESELKRALASLVMQTYPHMEVILVDDNADVVWNHRVEKIVEQWENKVGISLHYIQNKENCGSAESRNRGICAVKGKYVTFLDDDDKYMPEKISRQVSHMEKWGVDYSITDLALYNENGKLEEKRVRYFLDADTTYSKEELLEYHLLYHLTGTDTLMFRTDYLERLGGFPPIDVGDEFYLMEAAILGGGKFSYIPCCEVKAMVHRETEGLSSRESKIQGENALYEFKKAFFPQLRRSVIRRIRMRHYLVLAYAHLRSKEYLSFLKEGIAAFLSAPVACIIFVLKR